MRARAASFATAAAFRRDAQPSSVVTPLPSDRLSFKEKLAYGLGDTASNFYFQFFNGFLVFYYVDVLRLPSGPITSLMALVPTLVAFLNPVIGVLADRTTTRWGKFRPYILWGAVPYGILGYMMFANPALSESGKLVYAYVTYSLVMIVYAVINTPYGALMGVISPSAAERTSLSSYRFACAFLGALVIGRYVPKLTLYLTELSGDRGTAYRITMALFAVTSVAMFLYTFLATRERVSPPPEQKTSLKEDLRVVAGNFPWFVLFVAGFLNLANVGLRNGAGVFYFKYCVGQEAALADFNTVGFGCFILGAFSTKFLTRFFARPRLMVVLTVINALGMAACYFVDPHNLPLLYACNIVASLAAGPTPAIVWSLYADTADYGEWKFGRRTTGLIFSATVIGHKIGLAIGGALLAWLTGQAVAHLAMPNDGALQRINLAFSLLPGVFGLLSGISILFYSIDEPQVKQIERDLAARKGGPAPAPAP